MFEKSQEELKILGAQATTLEIKQQPELWLESFKYYRNNEEKINSFLRRVIEIHKHIRIIFTGAGTSAYIGDTILPYLKKVVNEKVYELESVPTTSIVSNPLEYFKEDIPTILVSFARSGNSPESVATVELGKKIVKKFYQITITCAPNGELAKRTKHDANNLMLLMPNRSNDIGFAMTSSFTCMLLTALLIFDESPILMKESYVKALCEMGKSVIYRETDIKKYVKLDFDRVIYLGSGSLAGLTREAQLKLLELTAGQISTMFDSSMGFRHGPKSFVNGNSIVFVFVSNDKYTRQYDLDIIEELQRDKIAKAVVSLQTETTENTKGETFKFDSKFNIMPDAYLALPYIVFAQTFALLTSVKVKNKPDTPSISGTVNRVVKGVIIHNNLDI